jgi:hypothetical protein
VLTLGFVLMALLGTLAPGDPFEAAGPPSRRRP